MSAREKRFESMLFNYETTYRTDFRDGKIRPNIVKKCIEKPTCLMARNISVKDIHTLTEWRGATNVPFSLLHKPKDVVRTNPRIIQKPYTPPKDEEREQVQKTRPRLVMTPALILDDVEPFARKLLMDDVYTSSFMKVQRDSGVTPGQSVRAPFAGHPAPADPIRMNKLKPPYVAPEWRMDSASWDKRQLRAYCDPTREFWLSKTPK